MCHVLPSNSRVFLNDVFFSLLSFQIPILAFILDYILPSECGKTQPDHHNHRARLLLTVLAACNHTPEAQVIFVNELKDSLARALSLSESQVKHARLQALFQLILSIIDSSPRQYRAAEQNGIVKLFIKKGLLADLARVPQSLDLSSPSVVSTVNGLLKPLEKLSNVINLPGKQTTDPSGKNKEPLLVDTTSRSEDVAEHMFRITERDVDRVESDESRVTSQEFGDLGE